MGQSEDHMIVRDRQQFRRTLLYPTLASCRLAFWAMEMLTSSAGSAPITMMHSHGIDMQRHISFRIWDRGSSTTSYSLT